MSLVDTSAGKKKEQGDCKEVSLNGIIQGSPPPLPATFGSEVTTPIPPPLEESSSIGRRGGSPAAVIENIQLKKRASVSGVEQQALPLPLIPEGSMGGMMNDLNKKLLARKKASEASAINLDKVPQILKYKENPENIIRTPPITMSKNMSQFPCSQASIITSMRSTTDNSHVDKLTIFEKKNVSHNAPKSLLIISLFEFGNF